MTLNQLIEQLTALRDQTPSIGNKPVMVDNPEDAKHHCDFADVVWVRGGIDGAVVLETN